MPKLARMTNRPPTTVACLLVDDREENLLALEAVLGGDGVALHRAGSGPEALEVLLSFDIALALVDVQMPGMDGFELAELMRGAERTRRVPIIFLTAGTADLQRRFRGYEAGAVDFLHKPIETDILRSKCEVFFELHRQRLELIRQRDELAVTTRENARLLEESRLAAEALVDADKRKDEFLATLAHELRNPLAPLRAGLHLLRLSPDGDHVARTREMMDRQLVHMVRLIDDLLDVSRVSNGKLTLRTERVSVQSVVRTAIEAVRPLVESAGHELTTRMPDAPVVVDGDPIRLAQVVGNLLTNAAKYTPEGGRIAVAVAGEADAVVLRVADTGSGIPADMLPKVFDLFTQVGTVRDRSQGGLGIGLALVRKLVEMHGGTVVAESPGIGQGSTFVVRLPAEAPSAPPAETAAGPARPGRTVSGRRVMIVDDNADTVETMAMMLDLDGHRTETAGDGPAALAAIPVFRPDVLILDLGMPGMSGYEVAERARSLGLLDGCVLVALTGRGSDEDKQKSRAAGFDFHLTKPVESADLDAVLRRA